MLVMQSNLFNTHAFVCDRLVCTYLNKPNIEQTEDSELIRILFQSYVRCHRIQWLLLNWSVSVSHQSRTPVAYMIWMSRQCLIGFYLNAFSRARVHRIHQPREHDWKIEKKKPFIRMTRLFVAHKFTDWLMCTSRSTLERIVTMVFNRIVAH